MNNTRLTQEVNMNTTGYSEYDFYFSNDTEFGDSLITDSEQSLSSTPRTRACQTHINFQFACVGCIAGLLCIFGITGNVLAYLIFTRGRQKSAVLLMLRALAVADSLYLLSYFVVQSWYQILIYLGKLNSIFYLY